MLKHNNTYLRWYNNNKTSNNVPSPSRQYIHSAPPLTVDLKKSVLRIPNLAIHLQTPTEREAFKVNKEDHLQPILAGYISKALTGDNNVTKWTEGHEPLILNSLASYLGCTVNEIVDFELHLYDTLGCKFNGMGEEFITGSRLDNLMGCFVCLRRWG